MCPATPLKWNPEEKLYTSFTLFRWLVWTSVSSSSMTRCPPYSSRWYLGALLSGASWGWTSLGRGWQKPGGILGRGWTGPLGRITLFMIFLYEEHFGISNSENKYFQKENISGLGWKDPKYITDSVNIFCSTEPCAHFLIRQMVTIQMIQIQMI